MAKAKRQRRNSIRTMGADSSALDALEALERAERESGEARAEDDDADPDDADAPVASTTGERED